MGRHPLALDIEAELGNYEVSIRSNVLQAISSAPGFDGRNDDLERVLEDVLVAQHKHFKIVVGKLLKLFEEGKKTGIGNIIPGKLGLAE